LEHANICVANENDEE